MESMEVLLLLQAFTNIYVRPTTVFVLLVQRLVLHQIRWQLVKLLARGERACVCVTSYVREMSDMQ